MLHHIPYLFSNRHGLAACSASLHVALMTFTPLSSVLSCERHPGWILQIVRKPQRDSARAMGTMVYHQDVSYSRDVMHLLSHAGVASVHAPACTGRAWATAACRACTTAPRRPSPATCTPTAAPTPSTRHEPPPHDGPGDALCVCPGAVQIVGDRSLVTIVLCCTGKTLTPPCLAMCPSAIPGVSDRNCTITVLCCTEEPLS